MFARRVTMFQPDISPRLMQRQLDTFKEMLLDPTPSVRATGVCGQAKRWK